MSHSSPAVVPPHLRLPLTQLDSLASGAFRRDAMETLLSAERSRRLLLLRAVLDYARARPDATGPLPPVDAAWNLLLRAESAAPAVVADMIADPQTGTWVAHTLRRLRDVGDDPAPLWFHVGQLHSLAVAAAISAGISARMTIPVWNGRALLPSLGVVHLPVDAVWGHAEVSLSTVVTIRCADTITEFDPQSGSGNGWFSLPWLRTSAGGLNLAVRLDSQSAYRGLDNPVPPLSLDEAGVSRWQALLDEAWALLTRDHPDRARDLAMGMTSLVAEPPAFRFRPRSTSVEDSFGSAIFSQPHDAVQFAVTLIHEFQHSVLNGVRHLVDLVDGDDAADGYAPWRDDPRPLGALMHGVFAFTAVAEFWAVQRTRVNGPEADFAHFEFSLWRYQTTRVLHAIDGRPGLTEAGKRFLDGIGGRMNKLSTERVPALIETAARAAADDHAASWRACHLRADPDRVRVLAEAWAAGRPVPPANGTAASVVEPGRVAQRLDAKAVLTQVRIADPDLFSRLRDEPQIVLGASPADVAYVAGDLASARRSYLAELTDTPDRAAAWSGLGLTLRAEGQDKTSEILLHRPELLRGITALMTDAERPPPDRLAAWLAGAD